MFQNVDDKENKTRQRTVDHLIGSVRGKSRSPRAADRRSNANQIEFIWQKDRNAT